MNRISRIGLTRSSSMRAVRDFSADSSAESQFFKNWINKSKLSYLNYYYTNSLIASINRIHLLHLYTIGLVVGP